MDSIDIMSPAPGGGMWHWRASGAALRGREGCVGVNSDDNTSRATPRDRSRAPTAPQSPSVPRIPPGRAEPLRRPSSAASHRQELGTLYQLNQVF